MTMQLYFTYGKNEATKVDLWVGGFVEEPFAPTAPGAGDLSVTDKFTAVFKGATAAANRTSLRALQLVFEYARDYPDDPYGPWLYYSPDATIAWRSRVLGGSAQLLNTLAGDMSNGQLRAAVSVERAPWFESARTELALTNLHGSGVTGGIQVDQCLDSTHDSTVQIAGAAVGGDLPAPCEVVINPDIDHSFYSWSDVLYTADGKIDATYVIKASLNTTNLVADSGCCDGNYDHLLASSSSIDRYWSVDPNSRLFYEPVLVIARLRFPAVRTYQINLKRNTTTLQSIYYTPPDTTNFRPVLIGVLQGRPGAAVYAGRIEVVGLEVGEYLDVDFAEALPVSGWRRITSPDPEAGTYELYRVDDDPGIDLVSLDGPGFDTAQVSGGGIFLAPGATQKIYFRFFREAPNSTFYINFTDSFKVQVFTRARRRSL